MLVIGLGYKARQGKNTAAVAMHNAAPIECRGRFYSFADALRMEVQKAVRMYGGQAQLIEAWRTVPLFNSGMTLPDWVIPEEGKPRTLLQFWGTNFRRAQDPDYWVKRLQDTLDRDKPDMAIITDVRFPNETAHIHAIGGYLVKVTRDGKPDIAVPSHPSELALDCYTGWDFEVKAATLVELHEKAAAVYREIVRTHDVKNQDNLL